MTPFDSFRSLPYRERISLVLCGIGGAVFCWICVGLVLGGNG